MAELATSSSSGPAVMRGNLMGKEVDLGELVTGLNNSFKRVEDGDLSGLEAMLVSQATALQTMFSSLARRAARAKSP